ncbi:MAG: DEAD/DEAH box helicase [Bacteroidaceae bacterium]|nr:DEAD/DEAH box helicase [Bacteroidaceae bacterium]
MLRMQQAQREDFDVECVSELFNPGEYRVQSRKTGGVYKVVYRGPQSPWNYCDCMDFKTSRLGTCKHIESARLWIADHHKRIHRELPAYTSVFLSYRGSVRQVQIRIGDDHRREFQSLASRYFDSLNTLLPEAFETFGEFLREAQRIDASFRCYKDALDYVVEQRERIQRLAIIDKRYDDAALDRLLRFPLYSYQREGVRFAARKGRAILADEMGLGKTVQALATAELLRREHLVGQVLVLCPATLKFQWQHEIEHFTSSRAIVLESNATASHANALAEADFVIVSYASLQGKAALFETGLLADYSYHFDMVIMDEVQRLKNWNTQMSRVARRIVSPYALILSGTPLENRLEDLYSIVELVDQFLLAPYYLFRDRYIKTDDNGRTLSYRNLNELADRVGEVLLRRRKSEVLDQLPERMDINLYVPMTSEQRDAHDSLRHQAARLVAKWHRQHALSEADRKQLLLTLSQMRMVCDSLYVLDEHSRYDTKVEEVMSILDQCGIFEVDGQTKIIIFSQWERMTRLVAMELDQSNVDYAYIHGNVPSNERAKRIQAFCENPELRILLSTDAGATGLNLQEASIVVNLDMPWNPAVLEQRVGRIHRLGQKQGIQVYNLIAKGTIEEDMLSKLRFKTSLFEGVLDGGEETVLMASQQFDNLISSISEAIEEPYSTVPQVQLQQDDLQLTVWPQTESEGNSDAIAPALPAQAASFLSDLSDLLLADEPVRRAVSEQLRKVLECQ